MHLFFSSPFFVSILANNFFKRETIGIRRWSAIGAGFLWSFYCFKSGLLMIFDYMKLAPVMLVHLCYAVSMTITENYF